MRTEVQQNQHLLAITFAGVRIDVRLFLMLIRKPLAHRNGDQGCANEKRHPKPGRFCLDGAMDKKDRSDDGIEEAPDYVDRGRGQTLAGRFCERRWEFITGYPLYKMRDGVGQEYCRRRRRRDRIARSCVFVCMNIHTISYIRGKWAAVSRFDLWVQRISPSLTTRIIYRNLPSPFIH